MRVLSHKCLLIILTVAAFLYCDASYAKGFSDKKDSLAFVYGQVTGEDLFYQTASDLSLANVLVELERDGYKASCLTDRDGQFRFSNLKPGRISLTLSKQGYETQRSVYEISSGENIIFVRLDHKVDSLKASKVSAEIPLVKTSGDTVIFNAAAVSTLPGEKLSAILEQLPGVQVGTDKITVFGRQVKRTYINGKLIYGDLPITAVNHLDAEDVKSVRVYEELNLSDRQKGLLHGDKDMVMDVQTKEKFISAANFTAMLAGGLDEKKDIDGDPLYRYSGYLSGNLFSEKLVLNAAAAAYNVSAVKLGALHPALLTPGTRLSNNDYSENTAANIGLEKYWKDRLFGNSLKVGYSYGKEFSKAGQRSQEEYLATGSSPAMMYADTSTTKSRSNSHSVDANLVINSEKLKTIELYSKVDLYKSSFSSSDGRKLLSDQMSQTSKAIVSTPQDGYSYYGLFSWEDNTNPKISPKILVGYTLENKDSDLRNLDTSAVSSNPRFLIGVGRRLQRNVNGSAQLDWHIRNDEKATVSLSMGYVFKYDRDKNSQTTLDHINPDAPEINNANTYDYTWAYSSHSLTSQLSVDKTNLSMRFGISPEIVHRTDLERYPDSEKYLKNYFSVNPEFRISYKNLVEVKMDTKTNLPSLEQIRERVEDSNTMMVKAGNPDLKPERSMGISLRVNPLQARSKNQSLSLNFRCDIPFRSIVNKYTYFSEGTQLSQYNGYTIPKGSILYSWANADRGVKIGASLFYHKRFQKIKSNLNINFFNTWERTPVYSGNDLLVTDAYSPHLSSDFSIRPNRRINIGFSASCGYNDSRAGDNQIVNKSITGSAGANFSASLKSGVYWNAAYKYSTNVFLINGLDNINTHWGFVEIGKSFHKGMYKISLSCHDLLNRGNANSVSSTAEKLVRVWKDTYGRYYMLNFQFNFGKKSR